MNYGMYLSAAGVLTNSYRQDVIANNLANAETTGFRRDVPLFHERLISALEMRSKSGWGEASMDDQTGGIFAMPTGIDLSQGELEPTGNPLDSAIVGEGFFHVQTSDGQNRLTRDGRMLVDRGGRLITQGGYVVLDREGQPISLDPKQKHAIDQFGDISADGQIVAQVGLMKVADARTLKKLGSGLLEYADPSKLQPAADVTLQPQTIERGNVSAAVELTKLLDAQRQLEANANMIRYQDQMLAKLVNEVGKIS